MEYIKSFVCGGLLCIIAQVLIDKTKITPARILTGYVCAGVLLTAIGVYEPIVKEFGCGATVPLTGFGYTLAKGVEASVDQNGFIGILMGGLESTAGGICSAIVFSLLISLFFNGKPENL